MLIYATANEADAYMFYICFCFFLFFCVRKKYETRRPFSGTAERIFMKLLQYRYRGKWSLKRRAAAWRMANVDDLQCDNRSWERLNGFS